MLNQPSPLDTPVTVIRQFNARAMPATDSKKPPKRQKVMPLGKALALHHGTDVMLAGYHIEGFAASWRLAKGILEAKPEVLARIKHQILAYDLDFDWNPKAHKEGTWESPEGQKWWAEVSERFAVLPYHGAWGYYTSRAGVRIYCVLPEGIPLEIADEYDALGRQILADVGLRADPGAKGWCHLMRAPYTKRDGRPVVELRHPQVYPTRFMPLTPDGLSVERLVARNAERKAEAIKSKEAAKRRREEALAQRAVNPTHPRYRQEADQTQHLERLVYKVAFAVEGTHNDTLSKAAWECGARAALGMDQDIAVDALLDACKGYYTPHMISDGPFSAEATILRSMERGRQTPFDEPADLVGQQVKPTQSGTELPHDILRITSSVTWPVARALKRVAKGLMEEPSDERIEDAAFELGRYVGAAQLTPEAASKVLMLACAERGRGEVGPIVLREIAAGRKSPMSARGTAPSVMSDYTVPGSKYMPDIELNQRLTGVHAGLGSGKTHQLTRLFANAPSATYVAASRSLITDAVRRFKDAGVLVGDYRDDVGIDARLCAVCLPSIQRRDAPKGGLVALDEIEALRQLLYTDAIVKPKDQVPLYVHLRGMLQDAGRVVVLDAHLTTDTMLWLQALMGDVAYEVVRHEGWQTFTGGVVLHGREEDPEYLATQDLIDGKRIAVACTTPGTVKRLRRRWTGMGYKVLDLHGESPIEDLSKTPLDWAEYDAIVYNPVMARGKTVGIEAGIDTVYLFAKRVPGMAYKTLLQLCHRVREPVSRVLHTFVDLTMEWGETNEDAITSKCIDQHAAQGRILFKTDGSGYKGVIKCVPRHYEWFVGGVRTEVARNKLCHDRYMSFAGEFASKGIRVTTPGYVLGEDAAAELRAQTNATIKQVKDDDIQAVVDAEDITASEALAIREDHSSTPEDRLKARRAGIRDFYERTPTEDIVREELKTQPRSRKLRRLVAHAQVLARSAEMHKEVIEASKDGKPHPGLTERFLAPQITWLILRIAGVDLSQGMEELAPGAEMSKAEIKAVIEGLLGGSNTSRIKEYYTDSGGLEREWTSESLKEGGLFGLIQALAPILPQRLQPGKDFADKPCKYIGGILRGMGLKLKCTRRRGEARRYSIDWETKAVMLAGPLAMRCGLQDHLLRAVAA